MLSCHRSQEWALLPVLYAYRDDGPKSALSRWKPRRVYCTLTPEHSDKPGQLYVVKYRQGQAGTAALISEVVCTTLLNIMGVATLKPAIVHVSASFSQSCRTKSDIPYEVVEGEHFGTEHLSDVEAGPPLSETDLAHPKEMVRLWVFDTWVGNIDRERDGNILLSLSGEKFDVIAADQSDCFCGAKVFCSHDCETVMKKHGKAPSAKILASTIFHNGGPVAVKNAIAETRKCLDSIEAALSLVPSMWWGYAKIDPQTIRRILVARAALLEDILKPNEWEVPDASQAILL
jgi:hypothetical protein